MEDTMRHDPLLRAVARTNDGVCYPAEEWRSVGFDEARQLGAIHYRQTADAARQPWAMFAAKGEQLPLFEGA